MKTYKISAKDQITIPVDIRKKLNLKPGNKVIFTEREGHIIIVPVNRNYFAGMSGILGEKGKMLKSLMEDKKREREL